jgi:hypothetical protein
MSVHTEAEMQAVAACEAKFPDTVPAWPENESIIEAMDRSYEVENLRLEELCLLETAEQDPNFALANIGLPAIPNVVDHKQILPVLKVRNQMLTKYVTTPKEIQADKDAEAQEAKTYLNNLKFLREHDYPMEIFMQDGTMRMCVPNGTAAVRDIKTNKSILAGPEIMKAFETYRENIDDAIEDAEEKSDEKQELYPTCPRLPGALADLASALYPSLPWEFKFWSLVTRWGIMRSGLDYLVNEPHIQPRFYTILVGKPNAGKTGSINESKTVMDMIESVARARFKSATLPCAFSMVNCRAAINSGQYLAQEFSDCQKAANGGVSVNVCSDDRARVIIDPDEASNLFEVGKSSPTQTNLFFSALLKLHSQNRISNATKQDGIQGSDKAHLAILASTTEQKYPMLWTGTGGGADGLVSRVLAITSNAPAIPPSPLPTLPIVSQHYERLFNLAMLPGQAISIGPEAAKLMDAWWASIDTSKKHSIRILEAVKQVLIVLAVTNVPDGYVGTELTVGPELMQAALEFGKYEMAVREQINPADSFGMVQAHENQILAWAKKHTSRTDPKSMNDFRRGIHPERYPGGLGSFMAAWKNCTQSGALKLRKLGRQKSALYSM